MPTFDEASRYKLADSFEFYKVNCQNKELCKAFEVRKYPTIKVFYNGQELEEEPGREMSTLLEYISKLNHPSLIDLDKAEDIKLFREKYGESTFLALYDSKNSMFHKCVNLIGESIKFKTLFYIGMLKLSEYNEKKDFKTSVPTLIVNYG